MLGFYNYTVWLTYASVVSAAVGIIAGMTGYGHPWIACICLILCGILDAFDGRVARHKKDRTAAEKEFGIQLDSFSDIIAFGVLPCAITYAMCRAMAPELPRWAWAVFYVIAPLYVLAGVIRLSHFNISAKEVMYGPAQKSYNGLPITSASFVFPVLVIVQFLVRDDFNMLPVCLGFMVLMGFLFLFKPFQIRKPSFKAVLVLSIIGLLLVALFIVITVDFPWFRRHA